MRGISEMIWGWLSILRSCPTSSGGNLRLGWNLNQYRPGSSHSSDAQKIDNGMIIIIIIIGNNDDDGDSKTVASSSSSSTLALMMMTMMVARQWQPNRKLTRQKLIQKQARHYQYLGDTFNYKRIGVLLFLLGYLIPWQHPSSFDDF